MDSDFILNLAAFFVVLAIVIVGLRLLRPIIQQHFRGSSGGWSRLAQAYTTTRPRPAQVRSGQNVVVGQVLYRFSMIVGFDDAGLYLEQGFPLSLLGRRALYIPWSEVERVDEVRLFWGKAALLSLGEPPVGTVTLPMELFDAMQPAMGKIGARAGRTKEPVP
jgi:hypothetical protein